METKETTALIVKGLQELGIEPSQTVSDKFAAYLHELQKWNRAYNLTALTDDREIVIKHFLDSLLYLKAIPEPMVNQNISLCDIGSGAGFPGIPLALVKPNFQIALVEPSRKKCAFLKHMRRTLSLSNVEVLEMRIEEVTGRLFDVAVTRALFSAEELAKKAEHVLRKSGVFILNKGPKFEAELQDSLGGKGLRYEVYEAELPLEHIKRYLIVLQESRS